MEMDLQFVSLQAMVGRCHTCYQNMLKLFCSMTCAPNQGDFIKIAKTGGNSTNQYALATQTYVDEAYMADTFASCRNVIAPSFGEKFSAISCGDETDTSCTAQKWYRHFGDSVNNKMTPFDIQYIATAKTGGSRFEFQAKPCNEAYEGFHSCSCADCTAACPKPIVLDVPKMDGQKVGRLSGILFAVFAFMATVVWLRRIKTWRLLGESVATHPLVVLVLSVVLIVGLSYDVRNVKVTTDPVKVWSAPGSRARVEKEFFEQHFGPFFRTQQVILKPTNQVSITYNSTNGPMTLGPAFETTFLREVFMLQLEIEDIKDSHGSGMEKSCYAPLASEQEPDKSKCLVQSLFGYFKNDLGTFNEMVDDGENLGHISSCLR